MSDFAWFLFVFFLMAFGVGCFLTGYRIGRDE